MSLKPRPPFSTPAQPTKRSSGIVLALLLLGAMPVILPGCTEKPSAPGGSQIQPRLTLLQPSHGDTLAGVVRCVAEWEGSTLPQMVSFLVDGDPIDNAVVPPWEAIWRPALPPPGGAERRLGAQAWTADGVRIDAAQVVVYVVPDSSPCVTLDPHPTTIWVRRDLVESIRASAHDPEDGLLPGEAIRWTGSLLSAPVDGESLSLSDLPDADQTVTATACDSRGQEGSATLRLRPFRALDPTEPGHCRFNLEAAIQAMDPDLLELQLATDFMFVPCRAEAERAGWSLAWPREQFLRAIRAWASTSSIRRPEWAWTPGPLMVWSTEAGRQAWQPCRNTSLAFDYIDGSSAESIVVARGEAALWMGEDSGGKWRILEWRDLPSDNETSLASLLAAAIGMPTPEPGLGCSPTRPQGAGPEISRP